jgi:predicted ferric reductase
MIGAGIGVTPFISILKDIKYKWDRKAFGFDVKRAYFFWMVNDQESFSWFSDLLTGTTTHTARTHARTHTAHTAHTAGTHHYCLVV